MKGLSGRELIVGVVFFAILVVLGVFTVIVSGYNPLNPPQTWYVYFPHGVAGLRKGNVVRVAGLEVGKVDDMWPMPEGVLAELVIQPGIEIFPGYDIKIRSFSPLGGKYVDVVRGQSRQRPLEVRLPAVPRADELAELAGPQGPVLLGDTEAELISTLADLAEEIKPAVVEAVNNIREATARLNQTQGTLGLLLSDRRLYDNLAAASAHLERASGELAAVVHKVHAGEGTLSRLLNDPALYERTVAAMRNVESITAKVDRGPGTLARLLNEPRLADDLERAADHLEVILYQAAYGRGTVAALLNERRLHDELVAALGGLREVTERLAHARGPLGVLLTDERAATDLRRTLAHLEKITGTVAAGRGTVGRLIMDDKLIQEAERVLVQLRESVEDLREQAPINAFTQAVFQAF
ncbi:MAG: ABC transporter substrate-binding protein [Planctomycetota bacterium]|nr:MAG: ABC transporter substrate-binding protein [Planctomycetota bacterium]